jgi:hypothetical protein
VQEDNPFKQRLKIVVPYRDRKEHLGQFLPYIQDYLADIDIPYHIVIAEQEEGQVFNRGAIKNAGFILGGVADYTCFHDVDYLPLDADYSWAEIPTGLVSAGARTTPIETDAPLKVIGPDMTIFFGGAVIVPDKVFRQVDGYSNEYWGWGYEDTDLVTRFKSEGITCSRRHGAFIPLQHNSDGHESDGALNRTAALNRALYVRKWRNGKSAKADGLSTIAYEVLWRETLVPRTPEHGSCEHIKVRLTVP